jgi:hypothetical protein
VGRGAPSVAAKRTGDIRQVPITSRRTARTARAGASWRRLHCQCNATGPRIAVLGVASADPGAPQDAPAPIRDTPAPLPPRFTASTPKGRPRGPGGTDYAKRMHRRSHFCTKYPQVTTWSCGTSSEPRACWACCPERCALRSSSCAWPCPLRSWGCYRHH